MDEANKKRSEAAEQGRVGRASAKNKDEFSDATTCGTTKQKPEHKSSTAKAKASKTNRKRSEAAKQQPRTEDGTKLAEKPGATTTCGKTCNQYAGSTVKAKASKTNRKRSEATKERERAEDGTLKASSRCTSSAPTGDRESTKSRAAKAKASKTNRGTVERMDRLVKERPDLADKVKVGYSFDC